MLLCDNKKRARIGKNFTPKASEFATDTRHLFVTGAAKREVPCPKALIDLGKLRKMIWFWFRFRLRFTGVR